MYIFMVTFIAVFITVLAVSYIWQEEIEYCPIKFSVALFKYYVRIYSTKENITITKRKLLEHAIVAEFRNIFIWLNDVNKNDIYSVKKFTRNNKKFSNNYVIRVNTLNTKQQEMCADILGKCYNKNVYSMLFFAIFVMADIVQNIEKTKSIYQVIVSSKEIQEQYKEGLTHMFNIISEFTKTQANTGDSNDKRSN